MFNVRAVTQEWPRSLRSLLMVGILIGICFGATATASTVSKGVSVAIPQRANGQVTSRPVSVAIPGAAWGFVAAKPVSVAIPGAASGFVAAKPVSVAIVPPFDYGQIVTWPVSVKIQSGNIVDPDLIGLWHMDGDWGDSSGYEHHGTAVNDPSFSTESMVGRNSGGFDGVNDYVEVANTGEFRPANLTISAWINPSTLDTDKTVITNEPTQTNSQNGFGIRQRADNKFWFVIGKEGDGAVVQSTTVATSGEWFFVTGTYDGSDLKIYVNGVLEATVTASRNIDTTFPLNIGRGNSGQEYYSGLIDEVSIYKRALTDEEIFGQFNQGLYNSPPPAKPIVTTTPLIIAQESLTISGTKEAATSLWVNGTKVVPLGSETSWLTTVNLTYGSNPISVVVKNEFGLESQPVIFSVIRDDVAPQVRSTVPAEGALVNQAGTSVSVQLQDEYADLDLAGSIAGAVVTDGLALPIDGTWSVFGADTVRFTPQLPLADGLYSVTLQPRDALGNEGQFNLSFTIDATLPASPVFDPLVTLVGSNA